MNVHLDSQVGPLHRRYRVVVVDEVGFRDRCSSFHDSPEGDRATVAAIAAGDGPYVLITETYFLWECPGCGHIDAGMLARYASASWEEPRWIVSGSLEAPTLSLPLDCDRSHKGRCSSGRWVLRNGELMAS